jgi:hypothetical protein
MSISSKAEKVRPWLFQHTFGEKRGFRLSSFSSRKRDENRDSSMNRAGALGRLAHA